VLLGNGGVFTYPPGPFDLSTPTGSWTTGVATRKLVLGSATTTTLVVSGFDHRTAGSAGALRLVAPPTAVSFFGSPQMPVYATLDLVFAPEPPCGALLGAALAAALAWRADRARRAERAAREPRSP
jgi:hypothetical protein